MVRPLTTIMLVTLAVVLSTVVTRNPRHAVPELCFDPRDSSLGRVPCGFDSSVDVKVTNSHPHDITVTRTTTSCSCVVADLAAGVVLQANRSTPVSARFTSPARDGLLRQWIRVTGLCMECGKSLDAECTITVEGRNMITIEPRSVVIKSPADCVSSTIHWRLVPGGDGRLVVTDAELPTWLTVLPETGTREGSIELTAHLSSSEPTRMHYLSCKWEGESMTGVIRIPVLVEHLSMLEALPSRVIVSRAGGSSPMRTGLVIRRRDREVIPVSALSLQPGAGLEARVDETTDLAAREVPISVAATAGAAASTASWLTVAIPDIGQVRVPVFIMAGVGDHR